MQYSIGKRVISSELAAKPPSQASGYLVAFLKSRDRVRHALDYGCGKLRYSGHVASFAESLTLVDSPVQLDRQQRIDHKETTVRRLARQRWPNVRIEAISEFQTRQRPKFDFVLCANVLSAIPIAADRARALTAIKRRLNIDGILLVVNQHTNSHYTQVARREEVTKHLDGWLVPRGNSSASYYGILDRKRVCSILETLGYGIAEQWIEGQSNYTLARIR